jgi:hypothetical protein
MPIMSWKYSLAAVFSMLVLDTVHAAEVSSIKQQGGIVVSIYGPIEQGDFEKVEKALIGAKTATLALSSPGGFLDEGLKIGELVHLRKFSTLVRNGTLCASACGYVWLAGMKRFIEGSGTVGFHAAYNSTTDSTVSSTGNALAGAYMARLGFNDLAVIYATEAAPREMRWLTRRDASFLGIEVSWSAGIEAPSIIEPQILTRGEIEKALLQQKLGGLLHSHYPDVYEKLVNNIRDAQLRGMDWRGALLSGYWNVQFPDHLQKNIDNALSSDVQIMVDFIDFVIVRPAKALQKENPERCSKFFKQELNKPFTFNALTGMTGEMQDDFMVLTGKLLELGLSRVFSPAALPTKKEKRYVQQEIFAIALRFNQGLSKAERKKLKRIKLEDDPVLNCRSGLFLMQQMKSNPKLLRIMMAEQ